MLFMVFVVIIYFFQNKMLYVPEAPNAEYKFPEAMPHPMANPGQLEMEYDDLKITTSDGLKLAGWFIKQTVEPETKRTMIFFHGNAGNIGMRMPNLKILHKQLEVNILIVGYRGYGHSEGVPTEEGLALDAEAVLKWAQDSELVDNNKLFVFGRSLGGAVAI